MTTHLEKVFLFPHKSHCAEASQRSDCGKLTSVGPTPLQLRGPPHPSSLNPPAGRVFLSLHLPTSLDQHPLPSDQKPGAMETLKSSCGQRHPGSQARGVRLSGTDNPALRQGRPIWEDFTIWTSSPGHPTPALNPHTRRHTDPASGSRPPQMAGLGGLPSPWVASDSRVGSGGVGGTRPMLSWEPHGPVGLCSPTCHHQTRSWTARPVLVPVAFPGSRKDPAHLKRLNRRCAHCHTKQKSDEPSDMNSGSRRQAVFPAMG